MTAPAATAIASGIAPLDERLGGLQVGGTHLFVGPPGPAKMVAALQFLHAGVAAGETGLLVTNADVGELLDVSRAWGLPLDDAWDNGTLQVVGFRPDFELRAIRTIAPEEILEELGTLVTGKPTRVAIDPGSMFLTSGAKSLLATAFMAWARQQPGTVVITFSVDGDPPVLPSAADWLVLATTSRVLFSRRRDGLAQITVAKSMPGADERDETITLELKPGAGLIKPTGFPTRRGADRTGLDRNRLLLVSLGGSHAADLEAWANRSFKTDTVAEPFAAVTKVQADASYGSVLVHATRARVREALQACRALRPLTRAAIVFASDDAIRSTDRINILESGADDCLSGGIDFRELGLRIKQAMDAGAKGGTTGEFPVQSLVAEGAGGVVSRADFLKEVDARGADAARTFFCVLDVTPGSVKPSALQEALVGLVRTDEQDLVSGSSDRCLVLLQGAREGQLGRFLGRLREQLDTLAGAGSPPAFVVLSHPADASRIRELAGTSDGQTP